MVIMVISFKDSLKLFGISIMMCCAITVCNMFMNYLIDLKGVESLVNGPAGEALYDAYVNTL